ncbi:MAG: DUF167 family protein [Methylovirgula sp.]|jgi:uncharacterized protein (TIGR00251 family)
MPEPWRARADGLLVAVRVTPKSRRDAVEGIDALADGRSVLKVRVRAVPEAGAANAALLRLLAQAAGLPASAASLETGGGSRLKLVALKGDPAAIAQKLVAWIEKAPRA